METNDAAAGFAALGQPTRLALLRLLLTAGPGGLVAGEISFRLRLPPSSLSFHLRALEQVGLVAATRHGRNLAYAAQLAPLRALLGFVADACCAGRPELCGDIATLIPEDTGMKTFNVLFLCTRNSARSIMAEAILDRIGRPHFEGHSAGSDPSPEGPLPAVLEKLRALGHDVSELHSKSWHAFAGPDAQKVDFVIALCDTLDGQACPDFGDTVITAAWPLPDPAKFSGNEAERASLLNELYASLRRRLEIFISLPVTTLDRIALRARVEELADPKVMG